MPDQASLNIEDGYGNPDRLRKLFLVAAVLYPFWHLAAPSSAVDPWWAWWAVAGAFLSVVGAS
jgi:hypothetical protein